MTDRRRQLDEMVSTLYATLRATAARALRSTGVRRTISPTDLVNECYLKLARARALGDLSRTDFVALACRAMRNVLVDRAPESLRSHASLLVSRQTSALVREMRRAALPTSIGSIE